MFTAIIALALVAQTPAPAPRPQAQAEKQSEYQAGLKAQVAKKRARRTAENVARANRDRAQAAAEYKAQIKAQAEYKAALPFLLEAQRQQLARLSAMERNAALHRMAAADEQIARAITLDVVARQNASMGYSTPALNTYGPGVTAYGPYGAVMYPNAGTPTVNPQAQGQAALESMMPR